MNFRFSKYCTIAKLTLRCKGRHPKPWLPKAAEGNVSRGKCYLCTFPKLPLSAAVKIGRSPNFSRTVLYLGDVLIWTDFHWDFHTMARATRALIGPFAAMVLSGAVIVCGPGSASAGQAVPQGQGTALQGSYLIAQSYGMPPADVGDDNGAPSGGNPGGSSGGDAGLVVRVGHLEEQVRQLNGQIEQLQYANKQLQDQLAKFQQDMEFRFQELGHKGAKPLPKRSDLSSPPDQTPPMSTASAVPPSTTTSIAATPRRGARGDDAFDPTRDPGAPGAPHTLGSMESRTDAPPRPGDAASSDAASSDDGPINLLSSPQRSASAATPQGNPAATGGVPPLRTAPAPAKTGFTPGGVAAAGGPPKEDIDAGIGYLKQKDYEDAERSFAAYIAKNPKNRRTSEAIYYLGETYALSGRQSEAAEQYLKISTNYASSPRAPEAMLRLGEALIKLKAKEQACATFGEVPRKYPNASAAIKARAESEAKKLQCG